jgi:hypothetical protein
LKHLNQKTKIFGAGLSKTGTTSVTEALITLGYKCLHFDHVRLNEAVNGREDFDFHVYDDLDAVTDLPIPLFLPQLLSAYPGSKVIVTVRDEDQWWESIKKHFEQRVAKPPTKLAGFCWKHGIPWWPNKKRDEYKRFRINLRTRMYGSPAPNEAKYREHFRRYYDQVHTITTSDNILVMDVFAGDGWEKLCEFLNAPVPSCDFPHRKSARGRAKL